MIPEIIKQENALRVVDPNPQGQNVDQEDLLIYVKLEAQTKSRTLLEQSSTGNVTLLEVENNVRDKTNFTYPTGDKSLTTEWTRLGGKDGLTPGEDVGTLGLTSINIDINASYVPVVTINMVDIRGATLFEQGPCSPYASFFHMPYPVFSLTVKGYYGKAVKYTLGLRKFNTKFNSSTGNFEITCEFIGYTYAFMADIIMGYILAAYRMQGYGAQEKLKIIWDKIRNDPKIYPPGEVNVLPTEPVPLLEMVKDARDLENIIGDLKNSDEFIKLDNLNLLNESVIDLNNRIDKYIKDVKDIGGEVADTKAYSDSKKLKVEYRGTGVINKLKEKTKEYFGEYGTDGTSHYELDYNIIVSSDVYKDNGITLPNFKTTLNTNGGGLFNGSPSSGVYSIDLGYLFKDNLDTAQQIEKKIKDQLQLTKEIINSAVTQKLGYNPTIRNVFSIIMANVEMFLKMLLEVSAAADEYHQNNSGSNSQILNDGKGKIYSWPTYFEQRTGDDKGNKKTYPGSNVNFRDWEEIKFVEEFVRAYTEVEAELEIITGDVADKPGFDNYIPLNPIESPAFDDGGGGDPTPTPNQYWGKTDIGDLLGTVGKRAFLFGDHTLANGLSIWKSRFMLYTDLNTGTQVSNTGLSNFPTSLSNRGSDDQLDSIPFNLTTNKDLMVGYGYMDGVNSVTSIDSIKLLQILKSKVEGIIGGEVKSNMGSEFKSKTFSDWVGDEGLGLSVGQVKTQLQKVVEGRDKGTDYYDDIDSDTIYTYSGSLEFYNGDNTLKIEPNITDQTTPATFILKLGEEEPSRKIALKEPRLTDIVKTAPGSTKYAMYSNKEKTAIYHWLKDDEETAGSFYLDTSSNASWYQFWDTLNASSDIDKCALGLNSSTQIPSTPSKPIERSDTTQEVLDFYSHKYASLNDIEIDTSDADISEDFGRVGEFYLNNGKIISNGVDFGKVTYDADGNIATNKDIWSGADDPGDWFQDTYYDSLMQTPLWGMNMPDTVDYYRTIAVTGGYNGTPVYYPGTNNPIKGKQSDSRIAYKVLAYLTLSTMGSYSEAYRTYYSQEGNLQNQINFKRKEISLTRGISGLIDFTKPFYIETLLRTQASQQSVPKAFVLMIGAVLWRMKESNNLEDLTASGSGTDPLIWYTSGIADKIPSLSPYKKIQPYHWPYVIKEWGDGKKDFTIVSKGFNFIRNGVDLTYMDIRKYMKTLLHLPKQVKEEFISEFENWSVNDFQTTYLKTIDPINFDKGNPNKGVGIDILGYDNVVTKNIDTAIVGILEKDNNNLVELHKELYLTKYTMTYTSPKMFYGIHKNDYNKTFSLTDGEFNSFLDGWKAGVLAAVDTRIMELSKDEDALTSDGEGSSLDDNDIKLGLYNYFQGLNEKWITSSENGSEPVMFYNTPEKGSQNTRTLLDHFRFVNRGMSDIGNKAVIDVTLLDSITTNKSQSLYQLVSTLVSKNNFDFHALPSFINFSNSGVSNEDLKNMFTPITNLNDIDSSPSFICMFVGGTSKNLDIVTKSSFCNRGGEITYKYEDDGTSVKDNNNIPTDIQDGGGTVAFLVKYGSENQSHFTSVNLDQAEFKETGESLMVLDQIAKGGDKSSRSSKGQNLFDIYQTRSYTCEVEGFGNMMIQPMSYFELTNVPMFRGLYLITKVNHTVEPNNVKTKFTGVRVPRITIPIVTEAYTAMNISSEVTKKGNTKTTDSVFDKYGLEPYDPNNTQSQVQNTNSNGTSPNTTNSTSVTTRDPNTVSGIIITE